MSKGGRLAPGTSLSTPELIWSIIVVVPPSRPLSLPVVLNHLQQILREHSSLLYSLSFSLHVLLQHFFFFSMSSRTGKPKFTLFYLT